MVKSSQNFRIMNHLKLGKTLSEPQAKQMKIGCLSKRISELRYSGIPISTVKNSNGNTAYKLESLA